jgi:hypothetical protein
MAPSPVTAPAPIAPGAESGGGGRSGGSSCSVQESAPKRHCLRDTRVPRVPTRQGNGAVRHVRVRQLSAGRAAVEEEEQQVQLPRTTAAGVVVDAAMVA